MTALALKQNYLIQVVIFLMNAVDVCFAMTRDVWEKKRARFIGS